MNDLLSNRLLSLLIILSLAWVGASARADDPPAEPRETGESSKEKKSGRKNLLKWKTSTEVENFGYDIYRGKSEEGPFERLNPDPIPGAGTTDEPTSYEFLDDTIDPHTTYWYYLESISMSGVKERFTSTFKMEPKSAPKAASDPNAGSE